MKTTENGTRLIVAASDIDADMRNKRRLMRKCSRIF